MSRYKISIKSAKKLQRWTLEVSGAKEFLDSLSEFPKKGKIKPGLYVNYEIDKDELDDGLDWPAPAVATIYAVLENNSEEIYLGEIRAYNFETFWLSTREDEEVDNAKNWFELIKEDYEKLVKSGKKNTKDAKMNEKINNKEEIVK